MVGKSKDKIKRHCPVCNSTRLVENEFGSLRCVKCGYMFIKQKK
jgi:ribosomal protein L37AE/L43A